MLSGAEIIKNEKGEKIIFNYGIPQKKAFNYIDTSNLMTYNTQNDTYTKLGFYPKRYRTDKIPEYYTQFKLLNDSECVFTYSMQDELYKLNLNTNKIIQKNDFNIGYQYPKYEKNKDGNLGYLRNFLLSAGANIKMEVTNNGYIVLIKFLPTQLMAHRAYTKYYVFNKDLKLLYADTIRQITNSMFIEKYKNGFLLISDLKDKLYYYEIN